MKKNVIKVEYISVNRQGTPDEWVSIEIVEFNSTEDAIAFIDGLPKDRRVTEIEDVVGKAYNKNTKKILYK